MINKYGIQRLINLNKLVIRTKSGPNLFGFQTQMYKILKFSKSKFSLYICYTQYKLLVTFLFSKFSVNMAENTLKMIMRPEVIILKEYKSPPFCNSILWNGKICPDCRLTRRSRPSGEKFDHYSWANIFKHVLKLFLNTDSSYFQIQIVFLNTLSVIT